LRIGYAAIPHNRKLLPVTSRKSALETMQRLMNVAKYNGSLGIDFYRIPANISPYESLEQIEEAREDVERLGQLFRELDIRTAFHMTYYCILNTPDPGVLEKSIDELRCLCLYDRYAGGGNHIEIHGGGTYGDREAATRRLIGRMLGLDDDIFRMLRLENDEHAGKVGTIEDLERVHRETGVPLIFDVAHYRINPRERREPIRDIVSRFLATWQGAGTCPVLHYSTTRPHAGAHLPVDPADFRDVLGELSGLVFDVMLETKEKEKDVLKVKSYLRRHPLPGGKKRGLMPP
jgi:UV DNA damage endonuclease